MAEVAETATKELTETEKQTSAKKCTEVITNSNEGGQDGQDSTKSSQDIQNTNEKEGDQEERGRNTSGKQGAMGQIQC